MRKLFVTALLVPAAFVCSCVSRSAHMAQVNRATGLATSLDELQRYLDQYKAENETLRLRNEELKKTADDAAWVSEQKEKLKKMLADLQGTVGKTGITGVEIVTNDKGESGLRVDDSVLFPSGKAELTDNGKATLKRLLPLLQQGGKIIRVDGHTDDVPISRSGWKSNLHLSAARALSVAEELSSLGVPYDRLFVQGFGPSRPASHTDKARNRRVEFYLQ